MKSLTIGLLALLSLAALPARAEISEWEQKTACMGDALQFCSSAIPDHAAIIQCLAAKHDKLSDRCRPVFDASLREMKSHAATAPAK